MLEVSRAMPMPVASSDSGCATKTGGCFLLLADLVLGADGQEREAAGIRPDEELHDFPSIWRGRPVPNPEACRSRWACTKVHLLAVLKAAARFDSRAAIHSKASSSSFSSHSVDGEVLAASSIWYLAVLQTLAGIALLGRLPTTMGLSGSTRAQAMILSRVSKLVGVNEEELRQMCCVHASHDYSVGTHRRVDKTDCDASNIIDNEAVCSLCGAMYSAVHEFMVAACNKAIQWAVLMNQPSDKVQPVTRTETFVDPAGLSSDSVCESIDDIDWHVTRCEAARRHQLN